MEVIIMEFTKFGNTGIEVSRLGFGAMRLPMEKVNGEDEVDYEKATEMIHEGFEAGINYIDTAIGYCNQKSEIAVGKALKGYRDQIYLSTKNPVKNESGSAWREKLETSLKKLDTDYIDFYHMWGLSWEQYQKMNVPGGPVEEAYKAKEEGLIKYISFSSHDSADNIIKLINTGQFASMLVQYNLLNRSNEKAIEHGHENGMGVVVMGPIGGGTLAVPSNKLENLMPDSSSSVETALRFVLANKSVDIALSGMENMDMVRQNVKIANKTGSLSQKEQKQVEEMLAENKKLAELYCTGCEYCLPCPQGINIPEIFEIMNYHQVYGLTNHAKKRYQNLLEDENKYSPQKCIECGNCEEQCPQDLSIIEKLKETHRLLGSVSSK
jgi:predicted aldo/keto reductase-like oxidoreductase